MLKRVVSYLPDRCMGLSLGLTQDVFAFASQLQKRQLGSKMELALLSVDGEPVQTFSGLKVEVDSGLDGIELPDLVILHAWWGDLDSQLLKQKPLMEKLKYWHECGVPILAPTTGSYFLAEAGLLDNRLCTTHWHKHEEFIERYPLVDCHPERFITATGDLYCSAGLNAALQIMVYLLSRLSSDEVAKQVEHTFLADFRSGYQHDFIHLADQSRHLDEAILAVQQWIEIHYQQDMNVQQLADKSNMSLRTFKRRFKEATGEAPLQYVQKIRIEQGRELLVHSNKSISQISYLVGYDDPGHFNRLFKRVYGLTPAKWRKSKASVKLEA